MNRPQSDSDRTKPVRPMDAAHARFIQKIMTAFGFHRVCTLKVCRRAAACAARHVVCYRAVEDEMRPIVCSIMARLWRRSIERGETPDVAPAGQDDMTRLLAREDKEIARIDAGEYGGDDELTPYQSWLKHTAREFSRRPPTAPAGEPGRSHSAAKGSTVPP